MLRDITEQKELEAQLIRTERLAAVGQLAASIAHEINSPLAGISALLGLVQKKIYEDKETLENVELIHKAFQSITLTVQNLLNLCRPGLDTSQKININLIIKNTVALSRAHLKNKGIGTQIDLSPEVLAFECFPQEISQVLLNFINNSVEAMENCLETTNKKIIIRTKSSAEKIIVEYRDTGPGIAEHDIDKIFDPFFTKKKNIGMGVGLSICHDIVVRNNGTIRAVASTAGAHFIVEFSHPSPEKK
nr:ATP-binding protein [Desulforhopalus sp. IMCC35007]